MSPHVRILGKMRDVLENTIADLHRDAWIISRYIGKFARGSQTSLKGFALLCDTFK